MAWWKTVKPGDPVVCVKGDRSNVIFEGRVYILREVFVIDDRYKDAGDIGFFLQGIVSGKTYFGEERSFDPRLFRPAQSTDLPEELTQLLDQPINSTLKVGA